MRYVTAIICALVCAIIALKFLSGPVADWVASQPKYDSSDDAEALNQMAFVLVNLVGMAVGWTIGWAVGGVLEKRSEARRG